MKLALLPVLAALILCPAAAAYPPLCDEDLVYASVTGDTIRLGHDSAHYNCCAQFGYAVASVPGGLLVTETEILPVPCRCECCFDLGVGIGNAPAGAYGVTLRWFEYEAQAWRESTLHVEVPDVGQVAAPAAAEVAVGDCSVTPDAAPSWGIFKSAYR